MCFDTLGKLKRFKDLVITLKNLYCVPSLLLFRKVVKRRFLDMSYSMLNRTRKSVHGNGLSVFRRLDCLLGGIHNTLFL